MQVVLEPPPSKISSVTDGVTESLLHGLVLLSPAKVKPFRRLIYLDNYGGAKMWAKIKKGEVPSHHLRGCLQLVRMGYEVLLAEPLPDFYLHRNGFPHDLRLLRPVRSWLGKDGVVFCGHNVLYWLPFLRKLGLLRCQIVSHVWANEPLNQAAGHAGVVALTPAGADQARRLAPKAKVAHLSWGADLSVFPRFPYNPEAFFSCGITLRDHRTISLAASRCSAQLRVLCAGVDNTIQWPANVQIIDGGKGWNVEEKKVSFQELLTKYYSRSAGSLLITFDDPKNEGAIGFTELIEIMAMARPIIHTRTGGISTEIDVERAGWGLQVPPGNPDALAEAITYLANHPAKAEAMGLKGRELAERHYNIERYARDLHAFFETL